MHNTIHTTIQASMKVIWNILVEIPHRPSLREKKSLNVLTQLQLIPRPFDKTPHLLDCAGGN